MGENKKTKSKKKKNKNRKILLVALSIVCVAIVAGICFLAIRLFSGDNKNIDTVEVAKEMKIDTTYGSLYYPKKWQDYLRVAKVDGDVEFLQFYGQVEGKEEQHLFDIAFGAQDGYVVGYLTEDGTTVSVNIYSYDVELGDAWTEDERNIIYGMQEDMNYIIQKLNSLENFNSASENGEEGAENVVVGEMEITTPYCTLVYPERWQNQLRTSVVEDANYIVQFFGTAEGKEEVHLFDLVFGTCEGALIGSVETGAGSVDLYIVTYDFVPGDDWDETARNTIYGMNEDVNYIISKLTEEGILKN